jgi:xanthosine utilization system XapX-like protein
MPARTEMLSNGAIRGEKALGIPWGFKVLHAPPALAGRLMGILGVIVEIQVLPMFYSRQNLAVRHAITFELIGDDDPRDAC